MLSTIHSRVTHFIALILMGTGNGRLPAWLLPTHCLHSLGILPPLQRGFRPCVGHVQTMVTALPGGLLACLVPTDCLRSLGNRPPFHRALRQSVGNAEAIGPLYDKPRRQLEGNCRDLLCWIGRSFLSALKQIAMATSKGAGADRIMHDAGFECTRENMSEFGQAGKSAGVVRGLPSYAKDAELFFSINAITTLLLPFDYPRTPLQLPSGLPPGKGYTGRQIYLAGNSRPNGAGLLRPLSAKVASFVCLMKELLESEEKGPEPLVINAAGHPGKGLAAGADHEDAAFVLPLKGRLPGRANNENYTLLDAYQRASSGSHEIILHNKTFKNEKITAKAACSNQCGMSARPKRTGINARGTLAELLLQLVRDRSMLDGTEALCRTVFGGQEGGKAARQRRKSY